VRNGNTNYSGVVLKAGKAQFRPAPRPEHLRSGMKTLASQIDRELQVGEWKHCVVYERELRRLWPLNEKDREAKITQFAKEYGFRLRFYSKGLCAIFDKWPRPKRRL
jgi:hypothetical protein